LKEIEKNYNVFQKEIPIIDVKNLRIYPFSWRDGKGEKLLEIINNDDPRWFQGWYKNSKWYHFPLICNGVSFASAKRLCPNTINILEKYPQIKIAGFTALFPYSSLPKHTDTTLEKNLLAMNMCLENCHHSNLYLKENKGSFQKIKHAPGKAVVYNSTDIEHYADNQQDKIRYMLFFEMLKE